MAVQTKSASAAADKWARRAAASTADYQSGVQTPSRDWATAAAAADPTYRAAVTDAANKGRFASGVRKAGSSKWQKGAVDKGVARWPQGIAVAQPDFATAIGEVLSTVSALTLPPRGIKGDPRNLERVRIIADALHKKAIG